MATLEHNNLLAALEALLFIYGEPLEIKKIAKIFETEEAIVQENIATLATRLKEEDRGLVLVVSGNKIQLATKNKFAPYLEKCVKEELKEQLTPASLETLSLIAYLGPLSRAEIEYYRGVNSTFTLRSLSMRGLIERTEGEGTHARVYSVSMELLKYLGISSIEELPEYEKFKNLSRTPEPQEHTEL